MSRIYAAVYGSGLGHATRTLSIVERFREANEFRFSSFDEGFELLSKKGNQVFYAPSVPLEWDELGGISGKDTFLAFPNAFASFLKQVDFESEMIGSWDPKVVLSDSRLSSVIAAKPKGIPVVTILNQIKILFPPRFRNGNASQLLERFEGNLVGLMWDISDKILFPDLPPPLTIGEANISNLDVTSKVTFTGFMIPRIQSSERRQEKVRNSLSLDNKKPVVFIQISGPTPTKPLLTQIALQAISTLSKKYNMVLSLGIPGGSEEPRKLGENSWVYDWCPVKDELFLLSDLLVARAGHSTLSQCISVGKPAVIVPIINQSEQLWNGKKFEKLGLGMTVEPQRLSPETLVQSIDNCIAIDNYRINARKISEISEKFDGIANATEILRAFV